MPKFRKKPVEVEVVVGLDASCQALLRELAVVLEEFAEKLERLVAHVRKVRDGLELNDSEQERDEESFPSEEALELRRLGDAHPEIREAFRAVLKERFPEVYLQHVDILCGTRVPYQPTEDAVKGDDDA